jgi:hypothetical protein
MTYHGSLGGELWWGMNSLGEVRELGRCFYGYAHLPRGIWHLGRYMAGWSGVLEPKRGLPPRGGSPLAPGSGVGCLSPRGGSPPGTWEDT